MIEVYLNLNGNAEEAPLFYAQAFSAPDPYLFRFADLPKEDQKKTPPGMENRLIHGNVKTFTGDIMLSDTMPGQEVSPTSANWISVGGADHDRLRQAFSALAEGGEVLMPLSETFFSPLYGELRDKYGFYWMFNAPNA